MGFFQSGQGRLAFLRSRADRFQNPSVGEQGCPSAQDDPGQVQKMNEDGNELMIAV